MKKRIEKNYNSLLIEQWKEKPIVFNRTLARAADSAIAGLFLSHLLFWWGKGTYEDWIYKTIREVQQETHLTRSEQDRAIRIWKRLGIIEVQLLEIPRKRFFHIDINALMRLAERTRRHPPLPSKTIKFAESGKLNCGFAHATTESTSKKTNKDLSLQETVARSKKLAAGRSFLKNQFSIGEEYHD